MESVVLTKISCSIEDTVNIISKNEPTREQLFEIAKAHMRKQYGDTAVTFERANSMQEGYSTYTFKGKRRKCIIEVKRMPLFEFDEKRV